jgi:hypothetical protein
LSTPGEDDEGENSVKRAKGEDGTPSPARDKSPAQHVPQSKETEEVEEVTEGVKEAEREDGKPEAVPLPASPPPEAQDGEEDNIAVSPTKSPKSTKSTVAKDTNVPLASAKLTAEPAADASADSDSVAPTKAPRKTRKLPSKAAKPSSKVSKKADKAVESKGKTSGEIVDSKKDGGSV